VAAGPAATKILMAFASDVEGEFWLGSKIGMRGSSRDAYFEVDWFDESDGTFMPSNDDPDIVQTERLLLGEVRMCATGIDENFTVVQSSLDGINQAMQQRYNRVEPWYTPSLGDGPSL